MRSAFPVAAAALVLVASSVLVSRDVAAASPTVPSAPPSGAVGALRQRAADLEGEIATANERENIAGEDYDEAEVRLGAANSTLTAVKVAIGAEHTRVARAKKRVRTTAVADYVFGSGAAAALGEFFTGKVADAGTFNAYAQVATHALQSALTSYVAAESRLDASEAKASAARAKAAVALRDATAAHNEAAAAASTVTDALHKVNGQLALYIAEQEKHNAAVAAQRREQAAAAKAAAVAAAIASADPTTAGDAAAAASSAASGSGDGSPVVPTGTNPLGDEAVQAAESFLGVPYVWGGASRAGVDCSGLTMLAWRSAGVSLLHSAWYQYEDTRRIPLTELEPGDLLFYHFPDDGSNPVTHVAMYVGSGPFGTQTIIQAPETGETVSYAAIYYYGFVGAGRPAAAGSAAPAPTTTTTPVVTSLPS